MIPTKRLPIHGRSMGARYDGSTAIVETRFPRLGEVGVYIADGVLRARRVVALDGNTITLRADERPALVSRVPPTALLGTIVGLERAGEVANEDDLPPHRPFLALIAALAAMQRDDREAFVAAVSRSERLLLSADDDHRCTALLARYAARQGVMNELSPALAKQLRAARAQGVVAADLLGRRVRELVTLLQENRLRFVLLKGAARRHEDEAGSALHESGDIDILLPPEEVRRAESVLLNAGYVHDVPAARVPLFLDDHHHLAPLVRPGDGFPVELHYRLADSARLSLPLDWTMLEPHMVVRRGACGELAVLDDVASALHLAVHAIALQRLRDIVLLGERLRALDERGRALLLSYVERERTDPIRLEAGIALAAAIAGVPWRVRPEVEVYVRWALRRNEVPHRIARYVQYSELRYAGRSRRRALWRTITYATKTQPKFDVSRPFRGTARVLIGLGVGAYTRRMPPVPITGTSIVG